MDLEKSLGKSENNQLIAGLTAYLNKMKGEATNKDRINYIDSLVSAIGGLMAILMIGLVAFSLEYPMVLGPIGASCLLVFGAHKGELSQPRNVIGGHLFSTASALIFLSILGKSLFTIGLVLAFVLILMTLTKTLHPPAAASAVVAVNTQAEWGFLVTVVLGALLLVIISIIYNNLFRTRQYPSRWL